MPALDTGAGPPGAPLPITTTNASHRSETMSDRNDDDFIRNPDTRSRRAWINRALQGVRRRLETGEGLPPAPEAEQPPPPHLYVVRSRREG